MQSIAEAQKDMRAAYMGGASGAIASATAWLVAAIVAATVGSMAGVWTLFFGGMLIFPFSLLLCKVLGRSGKHNKDNPLAALALEGTIWMLLCIVVAIALAYYRVEWFFPAMLLVIGGRYLTFATLYGMKIYWAFGATLASFAALLVIIEASVPAGAFAGALIEYIYGLVIVFRMKLPD
jgi:hypothetical protein